MEQPLSRPISGQAQFTRYTDGRHECTLDSSDITHVEMISQNNGYQSFGDFVAQDPGRAYDLFRRVVHAVCIGGGPTSITETRQLTYDDIPVFDKNDEPDYDPTELAHELVGRILPERSTSEPFELSIGISLSEEDRQLFGKTATRISLYDFRVEPNNLAF